MKYDFQIGQEVYCIKDTERPGFELDKSKTYIIKKINEFQGTIAIQGSDLHYLITRFVPKQIHDYNIDFDQLVNS